jgi:hypothetical protein
MKIPSFSLKSFSFLKYGEQARPFRDWFILLGISFAVLCASALWNAWLFYKVLNGESLGQSNSASTTLIDSASLDAAQKVFDARAAEEARYRSQYRFVDPSR